MDVEEHELVPEHEVIGEEELEEMLEEHEIEKDELPRIKSGDAALKNLEAETGDVIRIKRASPTAGETTYYRLVVED